MTRIKYTIVLLLVLGAVIPELMAQKEVGVSGFEQFRQPEYQVVDGVLKIYYNREKVFLEVPENMLDREFCISAQINRGLGWRNRPLKSIGVVRIRKGAGDYLCFCKDLFQERLRGNTNEWQAAFDMSNQQPLGLVFPVVAFCEEESAYMIDITKAVKNDDDWFQCRLQELKGLHASETELTDIQAVEDKLCFTIKREYGAETELNSGLPLEIGCVIQLLPLQPLKIRYADSDFPFASLAFTDYGKMPYGAVRDSLICRWRVTKFQPIVCYIDPLCPPEFVTYIEKGVKAWEKAFESAGLPQVLQVKTADRSTNLAAEKWVISYDLGKAETGRSWIIHPETGEIVYARLNIGHGVLVPALTDYWWECGLLDKRIRRNGMDDRVAGEILQHMVSREVGFLLGLLPRPEENYIGESVLKNLFYRGRMSELSAEDCRQLAWGYGQLPEIKKAAEKYKLPDSGVRFTEQWMILKNRMENRKAMFRLLKKQVSQGRGSLREYKELYIKGLDLYYQDLENMAELLAPVTMTDIVECLDSCSWNSFPVWLDVPEFRHERWLGPENIVRKSVRPVFEVMLQPDFLKTLGNESFHLLQELHHRIWQDFDPHFLPSDYRMEIQKNFLEVLLNMSLRSEIERCQDDYSVFWWNELNFLTDKFREMSQMHQQQKGKDYYGLLLRRMKKK